MTTNAIPEIPLLPSLSWTNGPSRLSFDEAAGELVLTAAGGVDWSNDALGEVRTHGATMLGFPVPDGDFTLAARVLVPGPRTTFDAGALGVWHDEDHWAKLCFEYSPHGEPMVVSVVTDRVSDDSNARIVTEAHVHLRIGRKGSAWFFHASSDGVTWDFIRLFPLAADADGLVGFLAQAPMGEGCEARFDDIRLTRTAPADLRDGS